MTRSRARADRIADDLAKDDPVYPYEFNDRSVPAPEVFGHLPFPIGAGHSLEVRYLLDVGGEQTLNPAQQALSDQMIDYWCGIHRHRIAERRGAAGLARRQADVAAAGRQSRRQQLRRDASVPVLGERKRLTTIAPRSTCAIHCALSRRIVRFARPGQR